MSAKRVRLQTERGTIDVVPSGEVSAGELRDSEGRTVDDAYVERAVEGARRRGRPSLSGEPGPSRLVQVRMDDATYALLRKSAAAAGVSASQWVREAIRERLNKAVERPPSCFEMSSIRRLESLLVSPCQR